MQYELETWPAFTVCGFKTRLKSETAPKFISQLWKCAFEDGSIKRLFDLLHKTDLRPAGLLGVCHSVDQTELDYYVAVTIHVNAPNHKKTITVPDDMAELEIPAAQWAIFNADGPLPESVQNTVDRIFTHWPLVPEYALRTDLPVLECYHPENRQEIWVAVKNS